MNTSEIRIEMPNEHHKQLQPSIDKLFQEQSQAELQQFEIVAKNIGSQIQENLDLVDWEGDGLVEMFYQFHLFLKFNVQCNGIIDVKARDKPTMYDNLELYVEVNKDEELKRKYKLKNDENIRTYASRIKSCINESTDIVPIVISLRLLNSGLLQETGHANLFIVRPKLKVVEHYEPHGTKYANNLYVSQQLKDIGEIFTRHFNSNTNNENTSRFTFISPEFTCPSIADKLQGFQRAETFATRPQYKGAPRKHSYLPTYLYERESGYCSAWSLLVMELTLSHKTLSMRDIQDKLIHILNSMESDYEIHDKLLSIIRSYSLHIFRCVYPFFNIVFRQNFSYTSMDSFNKFTKELKELKKDDLMRFSYLGLIISMKIKNRSLHTYSDFESEIDRYFSRRNTIKNTNSLLKKTRKKVGTYQKTTHKMKSRTLAVLREIFKENNKSILLGISKHDEFVRTSGLNYDKSTYMRTSQIYKDAAYALKDKNEELTKKIKALESKIENMEKELSQYKKNKT